MKVAMIIGLCLVGVAAIVVIASLAVRFAGGKLDKEISSRYRPEDIVLKELKANSFGREADGVLQIRGNGALVLTRQGLDFLQAVPKKEFQIPLNAIRTVSITRSHLGKAMPYDLLKVAFDADGKPDAIAWWVENPAAWKSAIEKLQGE